MIENNFKALLLYLGIDILIYALDVMTASIFDYQVTSKHLIFAIPNFFLMIFLFIFAGNRNLKDLGSKMKNLLSVCLISLLVFLIYWFMVHPAPQGVNPVTLYWAYTAPFGSIITDMEIEYSLSERAEIVSYCIFSTAPSLLMWMGLQRKSRKSNNRN